MNTQTGFSFLGLLVSALFGCSANVGEAQVFERSNAVLTEHVGETCVPSDEQSPSYSGASTAEVAVESSSACGAGVCLTYQFQGRVTCPLGYDPAIANSPECTTPQGEPVTVSVPPQLDGHPARTQVICSCRCSGPEGAGPFCGCPSGFVCRDNLVPDLGLSANNADAGGYCVVGN